MPEYSATIERDSISRARDNSALAVSGWLLA